MVYWQFVDKMSHFNIESKMMTVYTFNKSDEYARFSIGFAISFAHIFLEKKKRTENVLFDAICLIHVIQTRLSKCISLFANNSIR